MNYTVKQLADISGVSIRTLHFYDEIGLLKPSYVKENGYRFYEQKELMKLQQILFFKELEFPLDEIMKFISRPGYHMQNILSDHKKLLLTKQKRIEKLIETIDKTIISLKGGETMNSNDMFEPFTNDELKTLKEETKQRWGETDAYKQSIERTKHWTKADYDRIKREGVEFTQKLANAMGKDIKSEEVQALIAQHHKGIGTFYDCSYEMYRGLGKLYVDDPRFTAYYERFKPGLAQWLQQAINYYCDVQEKK